MAIQVQIVKQPVKRPPKPAVDTTSPSGRKTYPW